MVEWLSVWSEVGFAMIVHPFLYATPAQLEIAKANIARHEWARQTYDQLRLGADELADMELPKFETAWWQSAKRKKWQDTYPEINLHTGSAVRPAIYAAFLSALVYRLGGDEIYADRAKQVLLHYTGYDFIFVHPDVGLNYAGWGLHALWTYDLLYGRFTPEEHKKLDDFFSRWLNAIVDNDEWWIRENLGGRFNNHYTWHKLAMAAYGLFYGKPGWVERAFESEQGIRELMEHGFLDDGVWFESSLNYHYTALHGLITLAWALRNAGYEVDLFTHQFANGRTLEQGFSAMVQALFPDLTVPQIGDTYGHIVHLPDERSYEMAWVVYGKPLYGWLLSEKRSPLGPISLFREKDPGPVEPAAVYSRVFPEHGYVMLRSVEGAGYWHSDSWAAFLTYDLDSVHSHRDKLSLILFGRGKVLAQDMNALASEPHAFSARIARELNHSGICHNTLMVDGREHAAIAEKLSLIEFKVLPGVKTATIGDVKGIVYPGVKLQRTVAVTDDYVLDVFQAASDEEHTYDWLFHTFDDEGKTRIEASFQPVELPDTPPWTWLRNARSAKLHDTWQAEWRQGDVRFRLTMLGDSETELTLCDFPRNDRHEGTPVSMMTVRRKCGYTVFVCLYQAEKRPLPSAKISARQDRNDMLRVKVEIEGVSKDHLIPKLQWK